MAVFALTSEYLAINSVDITAYVKSATLTLDGAQLDTTDMASAGWVEVIGGLKSGTLAVNLMDDYVDDGLDEDLFALFNTVTTFEVRPTSAAVGTGNPKYTGSVHINQHVLGGGVGELAMKNYTWPTSGAVSRAVA